MPTLIEVWDSRLGIEEVAGPKHNPIILQWCKDAGHPEILDDETAWCSTSMCSAAKEAALPFPPVNVNPMARSWLTMGVTVKPEDAQPGDIMIEPRGTSGWQGHVSMIRHVKRENGKTFVRNIGGNQSHKSGGAVTLTGWKDVSVALPNGIRRLVPATVPALREAGSTTIKTADSEEKLGYTGMFFVPLFEGIKTLFEGAPNLSSVSGVTYWETIGKMSNVCLKYCLANPVLAAILIVSIGMVLRARWNRKARVAEHAAGIPIAGEVAKLQAG